MLNQDETLQLYDLLFDKMLEELRQSRYQFQDLEPTPVNEFALERLQRIEQRAKKRRHIIVLK